MKECFSRLAEPRNAEELVRLDVLSSHQIAAIVCAVGFAAFTVNSVWVVHVRGPATIVDAR